MSRTRARLWKSHSVRALRLARDHDLAPVNRKTAAKTGAGQNGNLSPGRLLDLQQTMGNAYVQRLLGRESQVPTATRTNDGRSVVAQRSPADVRQSPADVRQSPAEPGRCPAKRPHRRAAGLV